MATTSRIRKNVWRHYIGKREAVGICFCCKKAEMIFMDESTWNAGHIIADKMGGSQDLSNMRPICKQCNLRMGTTNMREFMKENSYGKLEGKSPEEEKDEEIIKLKEEIRQLRQELKTELAGKKTKPIFFAETPLKVHGSIQELEQTIPKVKLVEQLPEDGKVVRRFLICACCDYNDLKKDIVKQMKDNNIKNAIIIHQDVRVGMVAISGIKDGIFLPTYLIPHCERCRVQVTKNSGDVWWCFCKTNYPYQKLSKKDFVVRS